MTECNQETFAFTAHFSRRVEAGFSAGQVSSDGGALLLREVDRKINLLGRLSAMLCRWPIAVADHAPARSEMLAQRIYGLALGYEDLSDHEELRCDPLLALLSGKSELDEPLAGKSTLNRLELVGAQRSLSQDQLLGGVSGSLAGGICLWSLTQCTANRWCWTWTPPTSRFTAISRSASSMAITAATAICRCISSPATSCSARACGRPTKTLPLERWRK